MQAIPITYEALRGIGFRLTIPFGNYQPHMRIPICRDVDSSLEIGPCGLKESDWGCWIVSESSHRYGKFCFLRTSWTMAQVVHLYESLTDQSPKEEEFDADQFAESVARTTHLLKEHWAEIYTAEVVRKHVLIS